MDKNKENDKTQLDLILKKIGLNEEEAVILLKSLMPRFLREECILEVKTSGGVEYESDSAYANIEVSVVLILNDEEILASSDNMSFNIN